MSVVLPIRDKFFGDFIEMLQEANNQKFSIEEVETIRQDFIKEKFYGFVSYVDEIPVGIAVLNRGYSTRTFKITIAIEELYISEKYRNCGLGKELLEHIILHCRDREYVRLELRTYADTTIVKKLCAPYINIYRTYTLDLATSLVV